MSTAGLPRSSERHPPRWLLHALRPVARGLVQRRWSVTVHRPEQVPSSGGVILAANHIGLVDGPLLAVFAPRPVHALTKQEMFASTAGGAFFRASGQIELDRFAADPSAIKACLRVLRDGGVVGVFPEGTRGDGLLGRFHRGAAYLALATGAPVVPVSMFGTREPGGPSGSLPPRRASLHLVFGASWRTSPRPWPRTREQVHDTSLLLQEHMRAELHRAMDLTGLTLPGPLPTAIPRDDAVAASSPKEQHD